METGLKDGEINQTVMEEENYNSIRESGEESIELFNLKYLICLCRLQEVKVSRKKEFFSEGNSWQGRGGDTSNNNNNNWIRGYLRKKCHLMI